MSAEAINSKQEAIEGVVNKRLKNLVEFLEEMKEGYVNQAKALWVMKRVHLSEHPVNYYFRMVIDAGVIDVDGDGHFRFKYNPFSGVRVETASDTEFMDYVKKNPKEKPMPKKLQEFIKWEEIREKQKAGKCKGQSCPPIAETCEHCTGYKKFPIFGDKGTEEEEE